MATTAVTQGATLPEEGALDVAATVLQQAEQAWNRATERRSERSSPPRATS